MFVVITIGVVVFRRTQLLPSPISLLRSLRHGRRRLAAATAAIVPVASSWSWSSRSGSSPSSCRRRVTPPLPSSHLLLLACANAHPALPHHCTGLGLAPGGGCGSLGSTCDGGTGGSRRW
ncbi:hypothetical protein EDB86DRAFT_2875479 [Lactarius hatsudake]|nr:hypothetical protein EDB86DRAFT_2875479 [Lactarius hatsudake]